MSRSHLLSFCAGFLALGIEIVWMRLFAMSFHGNAYVTAFVLGFFLLGLAIGVAWYRRGLHGRTPTPLQAQRDAATWLIRSGLIDLALGLGYLWLDADGVARTVAGAGLILLSAASKGAILTALADAPPPERRHGQWAGQVMAANIAGATLGPLITCYVLFDLLSWQHSLQMLATLSVLIGVWALPQRAVPAWTALVLALASFALPGQLLHRILDTGYMGQAAIAEVVETRHGVFHRVHDAERGDVILGGNLYDGRINLDPATDTNGISRIYRAMASMPRTERVLMIGLGSGSWLEVIRHFPDVQEIQVVELADAYATLMRNIPEVAGALDDPRIRYAYTDGRRWLHRHPEAQYDLIVLNTTFYWRAFATNLLSQEFFESLRRHLREGGSVMLNTTESKDAVSTFLAVYPQAVSLGGTLLAPYTAPADPAAHRRARLFALGPLSERFIERHGRDWWEQLAARDFDPLPEGSGRIITEDNLLTEFSVYRPMSAPHFD